MRKKLILFLFVLGPVLSGCDLQPKIVGLPDSIDEFITGRYPTLLADPESDIYNSAAYDYGVYSSPNLYGMYSESMDDYVLYANVSDYNMPSQEVPDKQENVVPGSDVDVDIVPDADGDYLVVGMYGGDIKPDSNVVASDSLSHGKATNTARVAVKNIKVGVGDTLYSLSRKYEIPVNDLAVMNNIDAPFELSVGQVLKVPDVTPVNNKEVTVQPIVNANPVKDNKVASENKTPKQVNNKETSDTAVKQMQKIATRSSSKFSWPVRGKIISDYGAKGNGLFNDGINIAAAKGTTVKAAENGVVAYAGNEVKGMGNLIIVQHSDGWMTVYAHMNEMLVKRGAKVDVGQKIGTVGKTGKVDEPQLHFEVRKGTKAYNPTQYLKN